MTMLKHKPRAPGNYDANEASDQAALRNFEPSLTQQHQAEETDINLIVRRYTQTGLLPQGALQPLYGDFTEVTSFHEAQNKIRAAQEAFMLIPAEIRARFENDPGQFVDFASKEENYDELVRLKLVDPRAPSKAAPGAPEGTGQPNPG